MTRPVEAARRRLPPGAAPALLVLAIGLGVVVLRPPLPIDETRYLEVFRELLESNPILLTLKGEPYAEKPPLLFWLGRVLAAGGIPPLTALRCVSPLASALSVLLVGRIGRRAGLEQAAWMQAALWLPTLSGQFLFFDTLLAVTIWGALDAWVRRRDGRAAAWCAAALLAKGPVAYLFLAPLFWCLAPLRDPGGKPLRRASVVLLCALVPLAAWALSAAALGGPEFADALLWERWAGRVVRADDHRRPLLFYLPVVLIGALPLTPVLFTRPAAAATGPLPPWRPRLAKTLLGVVLAFSLISGKQAHYLVPAAPALALWLADACTRRPSAPAGLWLGLRLQLGLLVCAALAGPFVLPHQQQNFGPPGQALVRSGAALIPLVMLALVALTGIVLGTRRRELAARLRIAATTVGLAALPLHWLAGRLLYPHELARVLATAEEVAYMGNSHRGLYSLLTAKTELERLPDPDAVVDWARAHPGGLVLVDPGDLRSPLPSDIETVAHDVVHAADVHVLRARAASEREDPGGSRAH